MMKLSKLCEKLRETEPFYTIIEIHKEALCYLCSNIDGQKLEGTTKVVFIMMWYFIPSIIPFVGIFSNNDCISKSIDKMNGFIGVAIPLFVGVFFSLLLAIPSNVKRAKRKSLDIHTISKINRGYKQIASIILRLILTCIYIVLLFLLSITILPYNQYVQFVYYIPVVYLSTQFVVSIIYLTIRYFYLYKIELWN